MTEQLLVAHAGRYGSTAEIAERIGKVLTKSGHPAEVMALGDVKDPSLYKGIILGGPIYSGEWPPDLCEFIRTHEKALVERPVALFVVALRLRDNDEETRQSVLAIVDTCRVMLNPRSIGLFAGVMDYDKLSPIVRLQIQTKGLPEGDFRDWEAIEEWALALGALLSESPVAGIPTYQHISAQAVCDCAETT